MEAMKDISSLKAMVTGDTFLDLIAEQKGTSISQADTFLKTYGGEGFLTAVALSRLGAIASLSSIIGNDAFGKSIIEHLEKEGVFLNLIPSLKTSLRFSSENHEKLIYQECKKAHFPLPLLKQSMHIYYSTYLLKQDIVPETLTQIQELKARGEKIVLVLEEGVTEHLFKDLFEIIVRSDLTFSFGIKSPRFLTQLDTLSKLNNASSVIETDKNVFEVLHYGETGSIALENPPLPSLVSSYSASWFFTKNLAETLEYVKKAVFLTSQRTAFSTENLPFQDEIVPGKSQKEVETIHNTLLAKDLECMCFLTFDQTAHFEELARRLMQSVEEISAFKSLIYRAFIKTLQDKHTATLGVCIDNFHGKEILAKTETQPFALIRTIDEETKRAFLEHPYSLLRSLPRKEIIKVLFILKDGEIPIEDMRWLKRFYEAILETGHRLLIEIYDKEEPSREGRVLPTLQNIYKQGIRPALWKLQPSFDHKGWSHFEEAIDQYDPSAGILILGDKLPIKQLAKELKILKETTRKIKGFAIGRSLWQTVAEHWFEKRISDEMVESEVAHNFKRLLSIWENPSEYHAEEFEEKNLEHLRR